MVQAGSSNEGAGLAARPFVLLLFVVALFVIGFTAEARAALPTPTLSSTNPISPGASLTPRVKGTVEEGETKVITFGALRPVTQDVEPNDTVRIYTTADCTGSVAGEGTVTLLKGDGILVAAVSPDSVTVYYADVSKGLETSECSEGLTYRHVSTPPATPVLSGVSPASPANDNFPRLLGTADPDATISIYASADCSGAVVATGTGAQLEAEGIQATVGDNTETTFSALLTMAGFVTDCSNPVTYKELTPADPGPGLGPGQGPGGGDTPANPPPAPRLRTLPAGEANDNTPLVAGTAPGATLVRIYADPSCQGAVVAKGSAAELAAGIPVRVIDNAVVFFSAVSIAGEKASKCSDPVAYVEDSLTPRTRITMAPGAKTAKRKATIRFTDTTAALPGTSFLCKVDKAKWKKCSSPLRLKKLKPKKYTVRVKASDSAGNVETKGAKRSFKVIRR